MEALAVDVAGGAVQADPIALLILLACQGELLVGLVHDDVAAAGHAAGAHAPGHHGGVAGHTAPHGEDAPGEVHALDILGGSLQADQNYLVALVHPLHHVVSSKDDLASGGAGGGGQGSSKLEYHYRDMQDMEFTIENKKLFMLQTRNGKRTAAAALKIACDLVDEGMITEEEAVAMIDPKSLDSLLHPTFPKEELDRVAPIGQGLAASPGAAAGQVVFTADDVVEWVDKGHKVILVRLETSPEDIEGMHFARGILTVRGGMTSHAAVVARGMGTCCVSGCGDIAMDEANKCFTLGGKTYKEGDWISLDGSTGNIYGERLHTAEAKISVLHGLQLGKGPLPLLHGLGHNHLPDGGDALGIKEHVLRAAQADALGAEVLGLPGVLGGVGVGADLQGAELVRPVHDPLELAGDLGLGGVEDRGAAGAGPCQAGAHAAEGL